MNIVFGSLLFTAAVLFNSIELSLSTLDVPAEEPEVVGLDIHFYGDDQGFPVPFMLPDRRMVDYRPIPDIPRQFYYGVEVNNDGFVRPMFDRHETMVRVEINGHRHVKMTKKLAEEYGFIFRRHPYDNIGCSSSRLVKRRRTKFN